MPDSHKSKATNGVTASFVIDQRHSDTIGAVALALSVKHEKVLSRSAGLRHIINVYQRLDPDMRQAAIAADDQA